MNVYTIGFTRKSLERFLDLLREAGVPKLIDIRLRPTSQLSGFAKKDDLAYLLRHFEHIQYVHEPSLAPSAEILDAYRRSKDWGQYEVAFSQLIEERQMSAVLERAAAGQERLALLCSEASAGQCHRRLVAEAFAAQHPSVRIVHLE